MAEMLEKECAQLRVADEKKRSHDDDNENEYESISCATQTDYLQAHDSPTDNEDSTKFDWSKT